MICSECGAVNPATNIRCLACDRYFKPGAQTRWVDPDITSPVNPVAEPNIATRTTDPPEGEPPKPSEPSLEDLIQENLDRSRQARMQGRVIPAEDADFEEIDENTAPQSRETAKKTDVSEEELVAVNRRMKWIFAALFVLTLAAASIYTWHHFSSAQDASGLYSEGEKHFQDGNLEEALVAFSTMNDEFPDHALVPLARKRIDELTHEITFQSKHGMSRTSFVDSVLTLAQLAFSEQRFTIPEDQNALLYTREILKIVPDHVEALEIQSQIITFYDEMAADAVRESHHEKALQYYQNILKILPNNPATLRKIESLSPHLNNQ